MSAPSESSWRVALAAAIGVAAGFVLCRASNRRGEKPRVVRSSAACAPAGHYAQAIVARGRVEVSGLLPITAAGVKLVDAPFAEQAQCVLDSMQAILEESGSSLSLITKCRVYVDDVANWPEFNQLYAAALGEWRPSRVVVPVPVLHYGAKIEIECTAVLA